MTERERDRKIAESMETSVDLLPYLDELLADVWALGGNPDLVIEMLRPLGLPRGTRLLDLGCGKGGVCLPVSAELGFSVHGVDLFEPFLREAEARATQMGLAKHCEFERADIVAVLDRPINFDVLLYSALGLLDDTMKSMRQVVRQGGFIIIDDCFAPSGSSVDRPGYEHVISREETRNRLTRHGDRILDEVVIPAAEIRALDQRINAAIQKRAAELIPKHPEAAPLIQEYVTRQEEECRVLETEVVNAIWLVQRA